MKKAIITICMVLALTGMVFAGGQQDKGDKVYVFACDATWPPMEFVDESGDIVGFDMDLIAALAEAGGFKYEIKNTNWDGIFAGLANGAYDGVISSVTITEDRQKAMDFSDPYINAGQILVVRADDTTGTKLADFAGKKVGAQQGTTGDFVIEETPGVIRTAFDDVGFAIQDMVNGNVDAVVCDSPLAADFVMNNEAYKGKLKIVGEPFTEELYGIALQKGDEALLEMLNSSLKKVIDSGKRDELIKKWLR